VNEKAMRSLARDRGAELLDGPLGGRMGSDVPVRDAARTDLQHDENVQDSEAAGHRHEEVAGQDGVRVIPDEGRPPLSGSTAAPRPEVPEIPSDRARRDRESQLQAQFIGQTLLAPGRVCPRNGDDQSLQIDRNSRPAGFETSSARTVASPGGATGSASQA